MIVTQGTPVDEGTFVKYYGSPFGKTYLTLYFMNMYV